MYTIRTLNHYELKMCTFIHFAFFSFSHSFNKIRSSLLLFFLFLNTLFQMNNFLLLFHSFIFLNFSHKIFFYLLSSFSLSFSSTTFSTSFFLLTLFFFYQQRVGQMFWPFLQETILMSFSFYTIASL